MIEFFRYIKEYKKFRTLIKNPVWTASRKSVNVVNSYTLLNEVSQSEPHIPFCPRCGQIPSGDRRMQEAREFTVDILRRSNPQFVPKLSDMDFAIMWHLWRTKNVKG